MKLDDLARRAAHEVREASREARFSVRAPGSRRPLLARPAVAVGAAALVLAVGLPLLFVIRPWGREVLEPGPTTTLAPATTLAAGKVPAGSVGELVNGAFAALTAGDAEALHALFANDDHHLIYIVQGSLGQVAGSINNSNYLPSGEAWEVLGEVIVSGDVGLAPVRVTYAESRDFPGVWVGLDVTVGERVAGGFLGAGGMGLYAEVAAEGYAEADPAVVEELLAAQAAAWAAGDIDGVLAGYGESAQFLTPLAVRYSVSPLADFYAGMRLEFTGEPVISGPFVGVATRVTDPAGGVARDGVSIYWIEDGLIRLHALTTGE